jgi:hypothetical protein
MRPVALPVVVNQVHDCSDRRVSGEALEGAECQTLPVLYGGH